MKHLANELINSFLNATYRKIDSRMIYIDEKRKIAQCDHRFEFVSQMMLDLYNAGFSSTEIGIFLEMTGAGVRYHLNKMGCDMRPRGGSRISRSETGIPGVYYNKKRKHYVAQIYKKGKKYYLFQHDTKFRAAIARRHGEILHNYQRPSLAQKYIDEVCRERDCMKCEDLFPGCDIHRKNATYTQRMVKIFKEEKLCI